ncbi:hypothetical protein ABTZ58_23595 [Streptomyces sp. NPDC094143]|uniref:hypothetical protein n=1 Tax=Streptomyces sp. NPDC094143 TaxID=3155310 RepID=UPI00332DE6C5
MLTSVQGRHRAPRRAAALAGLTAALALGLAGCGDSDDSAGSGQRDDVASLERDSSPTASTSSADPGEGRPRIRLDSSDAEVLALNNAYARCLQDNGGKVDRLTGPKAAGRFVLTAAEEKDQPPAALKACEQKRPVPPPELDPQQNPHYADNFRAWVKCINEDGIPVEALPDGSGWNYGEGISEDEKAAPRTQEIIRACEIESFKQS